MADTEVSSRPSWSTVLASVLIYLATLPFAYYALRLVFIRGELDALLQEDNLLVDGEAVDSFKSITFVAIAGMTVASVIAVILSGRILRRSPGAREMGRLFFGLMAGACVLFVLLSAAVEAPASTIAAIALAGVVDAAIVLLLSLRSSREEFEKLSLQRWERRYYKDLEKTRRKEERLRRKAAKSG